MRTFLLFFGATCVLCAGAAAHVRVRGTLAGGAGDRVLAVGCDGTSAAAGAGADGGFSVTLPAPVNGYSLQLLDAASRYAGPVVLGRAGRHQALVFGTTRSGTYRLGTVRVGDGLATADGPLPHRLKVEPHAGCRTPKNAPGADPDRDGVPNAFDVDDNGNGTLDVVDPLAPAPGQLRMSSLLQADASNTINARVAAPYDQAAMDHLKALVVTLHGPGGATVACDGVSLCHGRLTLPATFSPMLADTIGALPVGQVLLSASHALVVAPFILTEPAITGIGLAGGAPQDVGAPPSAGGRPDQPRAVSSLHMTLRWMRPQRPPITNAERTAFTDSLAVLHDDYGLRYFAVVTVGTTTYDCRGDALDEANDPDLEVANTKSGPEFLDDQLARGPDGAPLTADFDFGRCATSGGSRVSDALTALPAGQRVFSVAFNASDLAGDSAGQRWYFSYG